MKIFQSNRQIVDAAHDLFKKSQTKTKAWRAEGRENEEFYEGEQWSDEDRMFLEENERPIVTFNRCAPTIDAVTGSEKNNRQEVRYLQRTMDDAAPNEMITAVSRWARDECDAEDEESEAFHDVIVQGMGWTETWVDFETDPEGMIRVDRVNPQEMYWDWMSSKKNLQDARWVMRVRLLPKDEIKERWPGKKIDYSKTFDVREVDSPHLADSADLYKNDQGGRVETDLVPVCQFQWAEKRPIYRVAGPDGIEMLSSQEYEAVKDEIEAMEYPVLRQSRREYFRAFVVGGTCVEKSVLHESETTIPGFTFQAITGKRGKDGWYGLMSSMKDPQRWSNKFFSQIQDIINSNAKGGIIAESDAFENPRKAEEDWAKSDSIIWASPGAVRDGKIQPRPSANYPQGLDRLMQVAMGAIRDTSGVNLEVLGMADRYQAGVVEASRIKQGLTVLSIFFDSLRRYRKSQGRVMLYFIRNYVPDDIMVRIVGEDRFVPYKRDLAFEKYDTIVDQAPTATNMKEEVWNGFQLILPAMVKAGLPIPPDIIDFLPIPQSMISKIKRFYKEKAQQSPEQKKAAALELEKLAAEIEQIRAKAIKAVSDAGAAKEGRANDRDRNQIMAMEAIVKALSEGDNEQ